MTTREVYYYVYSQSELPVGLVGFTYKDKDGVIQLGNCLPISFHDGHEFNIKKMLKIEKRRGFMFWNCSEDGKKFFEVNGKEISKLFAQIILNQK